MPRWEQAGMLQGSKEAREGAIAVCTVGEEVREAGVRVQLSPRECQSLRALRLTSLNPPCASEPHCSVMSPGSTPPTPTPTSSS